MKAVPASPADYQKIATANRHFYEGQADLYDKTESCVVGSSAQAILAAELRQIPPALAMAPESMRALDACGGSGNVALKLLKTRMKVTVCDISEQMLEIFRGKAAREGFEVATHCSEIADFLTAPGPRYHLITFSSALHHLQDIEYVLKLAFDRLEPGGALFTIFDPAAHRNLKPLSRLAVKMEYLAFKLFHQTSDFPRAILRRLRRIFSGVTVDNKLGAEINPSTYGFLAEYHVQKGIDDLALVESLRKMGYEIVWHKRVTECRFAFTTRILRWGGDCTGFELLARRPKL